MNGEQKLKSDLKHRNHVHSPPNPEENKKEGVSPPPTLKPSTNYYATYPKINLRRGDPSASWTDKILGPWKGLDDRRLAIGISVYMISAYVLGIREESLVQSSMVVVSGVGLLLLRGVWKFFSSYEVVNSNLGGIVNASTDNLWYPPSSAVPPLKQQQPAPSVDTSVQGRSFSIGKRKKCALRRIVGLFRIRERLGLDFNLAQFITQQLGMPWPRSDQPPSPPVALSNLDFHKGEQKS